MCRYRFVSVLIPILTSKIIIGFMEAAGGLSKGLAVAMFIVHCKGSQITLLYAFMFV
jgi:hypothetical protein